MVLGGNHDSIYLQGFQLLAVTFDAENNPSGTRVLIPIGDQKGHLAAWSWLKISYEGLGLWPNRPLGVAVSPEGWIYLSVTSGRIYVLRPL